MNIETVEDAMHVAEKEHKKIQKLINDNKQTKKEKSTEENLPLWFGKEIEKKEISSEEKNEIDNIINDFSFK